jgi:hypothetical protein
MRKGNERSRLSGELQKHLVELGRSKQYRAAPGTFSDLAALLSRSAEREREGLQRAIEAMLDTATQEAINAGLFGAPTMRWKGKLFFGNDRLALLDRFLGGDGRLVYARSAPG